MPKIPSTWLLDTPAPNSTAVLGIVDDGTVGAPLPAIDRGIQQTDACCVGIDELTDV